MDPFVMLKGLRDVEVVLVRVVFRPEVGGLVKHRGAALATSRVRLLLVLLLHFALFCTHTMLHFVLIVAVDASFFERTKF